MRFRDPGYRDTEYDDSKNLEKNKQGMVTLRGMALYFITSVLLHYGICISGLHFPLFPLYKTLLSILWYSFRPLQRNGIAAIPKYKVMKWPSLGTIHILCHANLTKS